MNISGNLPANGGVSGDLGSVSGQAQLLMLKKAINLQAQSAAQLIQSIPQPQALATEGSVGTRINTVA
jgi:hypothetical protein